MDVQPSYPTAKRRRTSSRDSSSSRSPSRSPEPDHPTRRRSVPYSRSRSHSNSATPTRPRTNRSTSPQSSEYSPRSRSPSPIPSKSNSPPPPPPPTSRLNYISLTTLPHAHARGITTTRFTPDARLLATGSADATIHIYSIPHPLTPTSQIKHLVTLRAHLSGINALAWSPLPSANGYTLASASDDKSILLWSPLVSDFPIRPSPLIGHSNYVSSLAFSPKGNLLVSGSYDEAVFVWDVRSGSIKLKLPAHSDPVGGVDFIYDGTMVVSCSTDGLIRVWDSGTGQCLRTLVDEDRKGVTGVRFAPNGRYVVAWYLDGRVRLWDYLDEGAGGKGRGKVVKTYMGHVQRGFAVGGCFGGVGGEGAFLVSGSEDGGVVAWDVSSKEVLWRCRERHRDVVLAVDWARVKDGRGLIVSAGKDRDVKLWVEQVDEKALEKRREREEILAKAEEEGDAGYAVEDEEMLDIEQEPISAEERHGDGHMQLDGAVDGDEAEEEG